MYIKSNNSFFDNNELTVYIQDSDIMSNCFSKGFLKLSFMRNIRNSQYKPLCPQG